MSTDELLPCPFCDHDTPEFERLGTGRQSCIVVCGNCGCRHESGDELDDCGKSWNTRAIESQAAQIAALTAERDALRADANRYRAAKVNGSHNIAVCEWDGDEWVALDPRMVDSRVDAAIKGQT